jgi:hypothetical protein
MYSRDMYQNYAQNQFSTQQLFILSCKINLAKYKYHLILLI